jgi:hypothetical protein
VIEAIAASIERCQNERELIATANQGNLKFDLHNYVEPIALSPATLRQLPIADRSVTSGKDIF